MEKYHDYSKQQLFHQPAYDFSRRVKTEGLSHLIWQNKGKVYIIIVTVQKQQLFCANYTGIICFDPHNYVYFFQEHLMQDVINTCTACSHTVMILAMKGVLFLQYKLAVHPDDTN